MCRPFLICTFCICTLAHCFYTQNPVFYTLYPTFYTRLYLTIKHIHTAHKAIQHFHPTFFTPKTAFFSFIPQTRTMTTKKVTQLSQRNRSRCIDGRIACAREIALFASPAEGGLRSSTMTDSIMQTKTPPFGSVQL